jgi:hypothetical protein
VRPPYFHDAGVVDDTMRAQAHLFAAWVIAGLALLHGANAQWRSDQDSRDKFQKWFPGSPPDMALIIENQCQLAYRSYLDHVSYDPSIDCLEAGEGRRSSVQCWTHRMLTCILDNVSEVTKVDMAGAAVLLGLVPTTLALTGFNTVEIGLLSLRRPFLAFLIAVSAPAVLPTNLANYRSVKDILLESQPLVMKHVRAMGPASRSFVLAFEYFIVMGATVNVAYVTWELCVKTFCSFALNTSMMPASWLLVALLVQFLGVATLHFQVKFRPREQEGAEPEEQGDDDEVNNVREVSMRPSWHARIVPWLRETLWDEVHLSVDQQERELVYRDENVWFLLLSWCTSVGIIISIIFGTVILSSTVLINAGNAYSVVGRYLVSALACRLILTFEMLGIGSTLTLEDREQPEIEQGEDKGRRRIVQQSPGLVGSAVGNAYGRRTPY